MPDTPSGGAAGHEERVGAAAPDDPDDVERQVRAVDRRVRRQKLQVERLNPVEAPERYAEAFERLVELEVELRDLKARSGEVTERD